MEHASPVEVATWRPEPAGQASPLAPASVTALSEEALQAHGAVPALAVPGSAPGTGDPDFLELAAFARTQEAIAQEALAHTEQFEESLVSSGDGHIRAMREEMHTVATLRSELAMALTREQRVRVMLEQSSVGDSLFGVVWLLPGCCSRRGYRVSAPIYRGADLAAHQLAALCYKCRSERRCSHDPL